MPKALHGTSWLQDQILDVVEKITTGEIELPEGKTATPHVLAKIVQEIRGDEKPPSTGAVSAVLARWKANGFILTHDKPVAFKSFSAQGKKIGLTECIKRHRDALGKARSEAKAADTAETVKAVKATKAKTTKAPAKPKVKAPAKPKAKAAPKAKAEKAETSAA